MRRSMCISRWNASAQGIVFDHTDMLKLARTLTLNIMRPRGDWAADIGGGGKVVASGLHEGLMGWVILDRLRPGLPRR